MPVQPTYPGVYVEEVPSGVRTIVGVATSITAFIGRAERGPVNDAIAIGSYADFERTFGGLSRHSRLGYAVRDFYLNGGTRAVIVRLFHEESGASATPGTATVSAGGVALAAATPGTWGAHLRLEVDTDGVSSDVAGRLGVTAGDLFNVTVRDAGPGGVSESYLNVTVVDSPRRIDRVLASQSRLARWEGSLDPTAPPTVSAGQDGVSAAESDLADAKADLQAAQRGDAGAPSVADAETAVATAQSALESAKQARLDAVSDGDDLDFGDFLPDGGMDAKEGLYALEQVDLFNLLVIPPYLTSDGVAMQDVDVALVASAAAYCETRRAMLLVDAPSDWRDKNTAVDRFTDASTDHVGTRSRNAALFFPRLRQPDPLSDNQLATFAPSGTVAGIFARTDTQRGVWKAPAGTDATLVGAPQLSVTLTDVENGDLNPLGVNCLRAFPVIGRVVWGARTLRGADQLADEYKYIPVRRLALYIEESLYRGTQWAVFEPNDEPLWAQLRLNVGAFMHNLFRQGAFQGSKPRDAYLVRCDATTTTQNDVDQGIVNVVVGFAPLKPAEFVILKIQQIAGQIEV